MNIIKFCGEFDKLKEPFVEGDFVYASDGRMAVRCIIKDHSYTYKYSDASVKVDEYLSKASKDIPIDFNFYEHTPEYIQCSSCKGIGKTKECPECEGTGEVECGECGNKRDCDDCDGTGKAEEERCGDCNGLGGRLKEYEIVLTDKLKVQAKFLSTIYTQLDNVKLYANDGYIYFTFDNGEGILLPLKH